MTAASAKDDQAVTRPTASMKVSIPSANRSAEVTSAFEDLAVVNRLAVARPLSVFLHVRLVRVVDLFGQRVLGDVFRDDLGIGFAQCLDDRVGERLGDDALVLDQVF